MGALAYLVLILIAGIVLGLGLSRRVEQSVRSDADGRAHDWGRRQALLETTLAANEVAERLQRVERVGRVLAGTLGRTGRDQAPGPVPELPRTLDTLHGRVRIDTPVPGVTAWARTVHADSPAADSLARRAAAVQSLFDAIRTTGLPVRRVVLDCADEGHVEFVPTSGGATAGDLASVPRASWAAGPDGEWRRPVRAGSDGPPSVTYAVTALDGEWPIAEVRVELGFDEVTTALRHAHPNAASVSPVLVDHNLAVLHATPAAYESLRIVRPQGSDDHEDLHAALAALLGGGQLALGQDGFVSHDDHTIFAAAPVAQTGWNVVGLVPRQATRDAAALSSRARAIAPELGITLFAFAALLGSIVLLLARHVGRWLQRRLTPVLDGARAMSTGDLTQAIPEDGDDEIGRLAVALNTSRLRLQRTVRDLEERKQRTDVLIQSMSEGFVITDREDRISFANVALANMLKRPLDSLLGRPVTDLLSPESRDTYQRELAARAKGTASRYSATWAVSDGTAARTVVSASPLFDPSDGEAVIGAYGVVTDLTHTMHAERELARAEKLRALGAMAGGVAHDFNNVLAAIVGNVQLALAEDLPEAARETIEVVERAALDGSETVRRIQEFTRMREGTARGERIDPNEIVTESARFVRGLVAEAESRANVEYEVVVRAEAARTVLGRASELREVVVNLVSNALDAMPEGGRLTLHAFDRGEDAVGLRVSDSGEGMTPEVEQRIFDPFFSTKQEVGGSGLGLSICYGIVRAHDGRIDVRTSSGGTTLTAVLPAANVVGSRDRGAPRMPTVLHVTPARQRATRLRETLRALGVEVTTMSDIRAALHLLRDDATARRITTLVVEHDLGSDDGWRVCRLARRDREDVGIVLFADPGDDIDPTQARNAGIDRVLLRPFDVDDVYATLMAIAPSCAPPTESDESENDTSEEAPRADAPSAPMADETIAALDYILRAPAGAGGPAQGDTP